MVWSTDSVTFFLICIETTVISLQTSVKYFFILIKTTTEEPSGCRLHNIARTQSQLKGSFQIMNRGFLAVILFSGENQSTNTDKIRGTLYALQNI